MKKYKYLIFFFLFISIISGLYGGYWIKKLYTIDGQMIYDEKNGCIFSFGYGLGIFDLTGEVLKKGIFYTKDMEYIVRPEKTIRLEDGTFVSISPFENDNTQGSSYIIFRFNQNGEILFSKVLNVNKENFNLSDLLEINDKIKILGSYNENNQPTSVLLFTLSKNGTLLKSKNLYFNNNYLHGHPPNFLKLDSNQYGIIHTGNFGEEGILILIMNNNDGIKSSKIYYVNNLHGHFFGAMIKKDKNGEFSVFFGKNECIDNNCENQKHTNCFLKLDSNWNLKWSKEYTVGWSYDWIWPIFLAETKNGTVLGINPGKQIEDMFQGDPVLIKINQTGQIEWSKKYSTDEEFHYNHVRDLIALPNGGMIMSVWNIGSYKFLLNENGEASKDCIYHEKTSTNVKNIQFYEKTLAIGNFKISDFNISIEDLDVIFEKDPDFPFGGGGIPNIYCMYKPIEGEVNFIEERSMFSGYYVPKINFSVDPMILPYITKFKIYKKYMGEDYVSVSEITKEEGKTNYEVELKRQYSKNYNYRIVSYNSNDEVVDISILE